MMMCVRCHKRPATVFVSQSRDSKQIQGYCFVCARELGIQPVNDMMDNMMNSLKQQTGMSDEELKEATEQMAQMMGLSLPEEDSGDDLFTPGGAATLPVDQMLGGKPGENGGYGSASGTGKRPRPKRREAHPELLHRPDGKGQERGNWTTSSAGRRRSSGWCRFSPAAPRTTPASSASPAVGKTAVAEGLALRIARERCPRNSGTRRYSCWT